MSETVISVGIDVGTSTTELVFSRLTIENVAGAFVVPRISIVDKTVIYRSRIYLTPLINPELIDVDALRTIVEDEYRAAGVKPSDVHTGAAIITGETARADNAEQVLQALSELAGDFVVAAAGPLLEAVLAARGVGIDSWSRDNPQVIANLDVGGGTTNIAAYRFGRLLGRPAWISADAWCGSTVARSATSRIRSAGSPRHPVSRWRWAIAPIWSACGPWQG